jgi:hypothetical protein
MIELAKLRCQNSLQMQSHPIARVAGEDLAANCLSALQLSGPLQSNCPR